jgi:hypothetical protein
MSAVTSQRLVGVVLASLVASVLAWSPAPAAHAVLASVRPPDVATEEPLGFPPVVFDDFQRTVSTGWGTSTSGVAWVDNSQRETGQTSAAAGNAISVDGNAGRITTAARSRSSCSQTTGRGRSPRGH